MNNPAETDPLYHSICELVQQARQQVQRQIDSASNRSHPLVKGPTNPVNLVHATRGTSKY